VLVFVDVFQARLMHVRVRVHVRLTVFVLVLVFDVVMVVTDVRLGAQSASRP
jgi:hypothetical protein